MLGGHEPHISDLRTPLFAKLTSGPHTSGSKPHRMAPVSLESRRTAGDGGAISPPKEFVWRSIYLTDPKEMVYSEVLVQVEQVTWSKTDPSKNL